MFHATRSLPVHDRFWAKVERTPTCWVWLAAKDPNGYGMLTIDKRSTRAHVVVYGWLYGTIPAGMMIDHTCHNRACVNPTHLRLVTPKQNAENRGVLNRNNTSGARGVSWYPHTGKWLAQVKHNGRFVLQAYFDDFDDAATAARDARARYFTHSGETAA